jgi:pimeloyl-ACP methyl ester carboxylesterase
MPKTYRLLTAVLAGAVLAAGGTVPALAAAGSARTSKTEARRVDSVPTPKLGWYKCYEIAECATVKLPLDYDQPKGPKIEIAVLRVKAKDQKHKIGSLFINPGGPGASASMFAVLSPLFLSESLLQRFDVVGMDPRGIGSSTDVACFGSARSQTVALKGMEPLFPYGQKEEAAYVAAAKKFGRACSTRAGSTGRSLAGAMSTAEVARDMDVMRRAVGDKKLSYLGFSYGTAIGQYYADMFPDRFRAIAVDGVINPASWVGSKATRNTIQDDRLRSADGAYKAYFEIMRRCDIAGSSKCVFASGNPLNNFATITRRLKAHPLVLPDPIFGGTVKETYADFIGDVLDALYSPTAGDDVTGLAQEMWELTSPEGTLSVTTVSAARTAFTTRIRSSRLARAFPYDNSFDAYASVMCTDGRHPADAAKWPALAAKADKRAPYFGRAWAWGSVQCARNTWTVRDEDAYTGPFTRRTASPVLLVGSYWDPATNYRDAVSSAKLLPNSRLLSSANFGHTAYGTSACATGAIDRYLLHKTLPAKGKSCVGDDQPFTQPLVTDPDAGDASVSALSLDGAASLDDIVARGLPTTGTAKQLPPVGRVFTGSR